ncbi:MAG: ATP-binding cassette domain-containing protein [bacterium]|nr:ATP-binding cassette domain-containing protein [bacterium]MDY2829895.1 ATP-binding cassette domain-containing protein [Alphaproteobacteria bacterium]
MTDVKIKVQNLTVAYGSNVLMKDVDFEVNTGDVFIIMGGSGSGKSSLLRVLTGLKEPAKGKVWLNGKDFYAAGEKEQKILMQNCGILYQSGALFSSMTLAENVALPLQQYTDYSIGTIREIVALKLALVGLRGYEDFYPAELSGGMKKRAGLARAMALDPEILFFDEPSAGLDPVSSNLLDDLILEINRSLGTTIVVITHELSSIFAIGNNSIYLDAETKGISAKGNPHELLKNPPNQRVLSFLTGGKKNA